MDCFWWSKVAIVPKKEGVGAYFCQPALPRVAQLPYLRRLSQGKHQDQLRVYIKGQARGLVPRQTQARRVWPLTVSGAEQYSRASTLLLLKALCGKQLLPHLSFTSLLRSRLLLFPRYS